MAGPTTGSTLDALKFQVLSELPEFPPINSETELRQYLDQAKYQVAREIGVPLHPGYNGDLPSREAGAVGGRLGGRIGGQMVRRMIEFAQSHMAADPNVLARPASMGNGRVHTNHQWSPAPRAAWDHVTARTQPELAPTLPGGGYR